MYRGKHATHPRLRILALAVVVLTALALISIPFVEPYSLQIERTTVVSAALPADVRQLRIVYVSDIHLSGFPYFNRGQLNSLVSAINSQNADLILLGGDYATDHDSAVRFFEELPALHATYGVYAVLGEHDRTPETDSEQMRTMRQAAKGAGVTLLVNEPAAVRIGPNTVYLCGVDDFNNGYPDIKSLAGSVRQEQFTILLSHSPEIIDSALNATDADGRRGWFDLGLFGHTHGGQIALVGGLLHIADGVESQRSSGWFTENRIPMLVSRGVGTSKLPFRLFRAPQIHVITIRSN